MSATSSAAALLRGAVVSGNASSALGYYLLCCFRARSPRGQRRRGPDGSALPEDETPSPQPAADGDERDSEVEPKGRLTRQTLSARRVDSCGPYSDAPMQQTVSSATSSEDSTTSARHRSDKDRSENTTLMSSCAARSTAVARCQRTVKFSSLDGQQSSKQCDVTDSARDSSIDDVGNNIVWSQSLSMESTGSLESASGLQHSEASFKLDRLFDISDIVPADDVVSCCGRCHVTASYVTSRSAVEVVVHETRDLPTGSDRGGSSTSAGTRVHLMLLPQKTIKHRTKVGRPAGNDVTAQQYDETFRFPLTAEALVSSSIRLRIYSYEKLRLRRLIGECNLDLSQLDFELSQSTSVWLTLEPRTNITMFESCSDISSSSCGDISRSPSNSLRTSGSGELLTMSYGRGLRSELLIGLDYNCTTGRLTVTVNRGRNLRTHGSSRQPDTYVKVVLTDEEGREWARGSTSVVSRQSNPIYSDTFAFRVARSKLVAGYVTILFSVYTTRSRLAGRTLTAGDKLLGWFALGHSSSGEDERSHWNELTSSLTSSSGATCNNYATPLHHGVGDANTSSGNSVPNHTNTTGSIEVNGVDSSEQWHQLLEP